MIRIMFMLAVGVMMAKPPRPKKPKPPKTDRCWACDMDQHHPGRQVEGCNCSDCGSGTKQG